ncbi:YycH family regulatory protein [Gracilibacillus salinarum]|uniref:Two-component system activity regulator YycH n=1 Tax=Gracilibacillus salinarum TaxID=2932255 RepID=A0ABY4GHG0_9BACI|nr:two-component system activity regulator YycH [Gracilibacillus salinarum]UOQ83770.1 two-component system activity regulator YycH [Gracilibacillus salinarum]
MKISFELIKTVLLFFLIVISFLLTFGIWRYEGEYEPSNSPDNAVAAELPEGTDMTTKMLTTPSQLVIHEGGSVYGFSEKNQELTTFQDIGQWALYNFRMLSENKDMDTIIADSERVIEVVFPTSLPTSVIGTIFNTDEAIINDSRFKRIYIIIDENQTNWQVLFDNENTDGLDIQASIQNMAEVFDYFEGDLQSKDLTSYVELERSTGYSIYIPNQANIIGKKFSYKTISPDSSSFKSIFFDDTSNVVNSRDREESQEFYKDDKIEIIVDSQGYSMKYSNYTEVKEEVENDTVNNNDQLIDQSIKYINSHNGWLVDPNFSIGYRLNALSNVSNRIEFRMLYQNYPIFSDQGIASMSLTIKNQTISQYNRPLLKLTRGYDKAATDLMTGEELKSFLQTSEHYNYDQIQDIQLGYHIEQQGQVFDLIPTWYVQIYGGWEMITDNTVNQGGNANAVGTN